MSAIKNILIRPALCCILAAASLSCASNEEEWPVDDIPEGSPIEIQLAFRTGGSSSRANFTEQEAGIEEVDVLVFRDGQFNYRAVGKQIEDETPGGYDRKIFKVQLTKDSKQKYELVVIANAREGVESAGLTGSVDDVLGRIEFENDGEWPSAQKEGEEFKPIPMYGKSPEIYINGNTEAWLKANPIELFRAMARIDLTVASGATFELTRVFVYNYNTRGMVAPGPGANWIPHYITGEPRVKEVTLPANPGHKLDPPLEYKTNGGNSCTGAIYLMETHKAAPGKYPDATCLVLEGKYNGREELSYYRLDLRMYWVVNEEDPGGGPPTGGTLYDEGGGGGFVGAARTFPHVLRNHIYDITVRSVTGAGYPTKEQAFENTDFQLEYYEKIGWGHKYVESEQNGNYLYVDRTLLEVEQASDDGKDVYEGWIAIGCSDNLTLEVTADEASASWLRLEEYGAGYDWYIDKDMSQPLRNATITVKAGNLTRKIKVVVRSKT